MTGDNKIYAVSKKINKFEEKYGYINKNNDIVIPFIYEYAYPFSCSLAGVRDYKTHLIGFIDEKNNKKIDFLYEYIHPFVDNLAWTCKDGLWGMIDINGNQVIENKYLKANTYKNNLSIVQNRNSKWGVIDKNDTTIIPFYYDWILSSDNITFKLIYNNKEEIYSLINEKSSNKVLELKK